VRKHLTYANVVSTLCLFIVLGGGAFAATKLPKNSVTSTQIKNGSIKGPDVAKSAITSVKVKNGSLLPSDFKASALHGLQGPTGPQGPAGKNAATNVVVRIAHAAGTNSAAVACAPGERAVGGGGLSGSNADGIAGSGLGLYMARSVVEVHGGSLTYASPPEGGAEFRLWLPAQDGGPKSLASGKSSSDNRNGDRG